MRASMKPDPTLPVAARPFFLLLILVLVSCSKPAVVAEPEAGVSAGDATNAASESLTSGLTGSWQTAQPGTVVEIYTEDGKHHGKVVKATNPDVPVGTLVLRDLTTDGSAWEGKFYVPKHRRLIDARTVLKGEKLEIRISAGLRSKTVIWTRLG